MPHKTTVSLRQLGCGVFLCLICESLIRPMAGGAALPAYSRVMAGVLCGFAVWFLLRWFCRTAGREEFVALLSGRGRGSRLTLLLLAVSFSLGAGRSLEQTETFYRYVSAEGLALGVFLLLALAVCLYAAKIGLESLLRTGSILFALFALSALLLAAGNAPAMRLEHLQIPQEPVRDILESCVKGFHLTPELLLFGLYAHTACPSKSEGILARVLAGAVAVDILLACLTELVLGPFGAMQIQPLHTLARIGGISVFRRIDAIHVAIWLLISLFRTALLCAGLSKVLRPLLPERLREMTWLTALPVLAGCWFAYLCPIGQLLWLQTIAVMASTFTVVFLFWLSKKKGENRCSGNINGQPL